MNTVLKSFPVNDEPEIQVASPVMSLRDVSVRYGGRVAVRGVSMPIAAKSVTALIGPSGCGKTTVLRCLNRLNDLIEGFRLTGSIEFEGLDIYSRKVDPVEVRRHIGMVFQRPNPFPMSIYNNVAFGAKVNRFKGNMDELVENALRRAALWDEVKDRLRTDAQSLSGGQQQRLCIARALAVQPSVLLMDEPCSALDPISTERVEQLITELRQSLAIVVVTHNMQQAKRISDFTAFFNMESDSQPTGMLCEFAATHEIFTQAKMLATRQYIQGSFG